MILVCFHDDNMKLIVRMMVVMRIEMMIVVIMIK